MSRAALALAVLQVFLVLVSWVVSAAAPDLSVRSLLGNEGIRWFFGRFVSNLSSPLLVWIILLAIAGGAFRSCSLGASLVQVVRRRPLSFRQRFGLWIVLLITVVYIGVLLLLTAVPQAILLGVDGSLFPSSLSRSLVPVVAFFLVVVSLSYGLASGRFHSLSDVYEALTSGLSRIPGLLLLYVLGAQLWFSVLFIFS